MALYKSIIIIITGYFIYYYFIKNIFIIIIKRQPTCLNGYFFYGKNGLSSYGHEELQRP